ncbi:hypothetical protein BGZ60DRAFT_19681 [Tricladium varicosporioides]|nr:hypothetical protein BGZ60DRAFT_19681 [Hymenoscyphus varicosporioides]
MKQFAWVSQAVQALAIDGKAVHEKELYDSDSDKENPISIVKIDPDRPFIKPLTAKLPVLRQRRSPDSPDLSKSSRLSYHVDSIIDVWTTSVSSLEKSWGISTAESEPKYTKASPAPVVVAKPVEKKEPTTVKPVQKPRPKLEIYDDSLALDYNPAIIAFVSEGQPRESKPPPKRSPSPTRAPVDTTPISIQAPSPIPTPSPIQTPSPAPIPVPKLQERKKRTYSHSCTIFKESPKAPITIILTTPDDEAPPPITPPQPLPERRNSFMAIRSIRTKTPIPPMPQNASPVTLPVPKYDRTRLMPPSERALQSRKFQKAQEFHEIRTFMIHFMNTKGDTFPKKLRFKMMDMYRIREEDLNPVMIRKMRLAAENIDEGIWIEETDDHQEHLKILGMAMRSQAQALIPKRPCPTPHGAPQRYRSQRYNPPPQRQPRQIPRPQTPPPQIAPIAQTEEVFDEDLPLAWLAPIISASESDTSVPDDLTVPIRRTRSTPDLQPPPGPPGPLLHFDTPLQTPYLQRDISERDFMTSHAHRDAAARMALERNASRNRSGIRKLSSVRMSFFSTRASPPMLGRQSSTI